jgi:hypothetical protein
LKKFRANRKGKKINESVFDRLDTSIGQILYKSYLPHPDSDVDVPHMNFDLLDETYPMVKSKLYFMVFDHTDLTGGTHRSDRSDKTCQFWV